MTLRDTHEHENALAFSYQKAVNKKSKLKEIGFQPADVTNMESFIRLSYAEKPELRG